MTGIIVSKFKNELFMFADGRVTNGYDFVLTDNDDKILKIDDSNIFTMAGDSNIIDGVLDLYDAGNLTQETVRTILGQGCVAWLTPEYFFDIVIDNTGEKDGKISSFIARYPLKILPIFFGSGQDALSGAYYAADCHKSKDKKEYIERVKKAYKAASTHVTSMGVLRQYESIVLPRNKKK